MLATGVAVGTVTAMLGAVLISLGMWQKARMEEGFLTSELGADEVVDYARDDYTRRNDRFDVVFDAASASTFAAARPVLAASGIYINTSGDAAALIGFHYCLNYSVAGGHLLHHPEAAHEHHQQRQP